MLDGFFPVAQQAQGTGQVVSRNDRIWMFISQRTALLRQGLSLQGDGLFISTHFTQGTGIDRGNSEGSGMLQFGHLGIAVQCAFGTLCGLLIPSHFIQGTDQVLHDPLTQNALTASFPTDLGKEGLGQRQAGNSNIDLATDPAAPPNFQFRPSADGQIHQAIGVGSKRTTTGTDLAMEFCSYQRFKHCWFKKKRKTSIF